MKQVFKNVVSVFLAIIVLFTSFSFTISSHYCGDILVDSAIFTEAEDCGMMDEHENVCSTETMDKLCFENDSMHCKDVNKLFEGNSIEQQAFEIAKLQKVYFAIAYITSYELLFADTTSNTIAYHHYIPPLVTNDLTVLFENFRI